MEFVQGLGIADLQDYWRVKLEEAGGVVVNALFECIKDLCQICALGPGFVFEKGILLGAIW